MRAEEERAKLHASGLDGNFWATHSPAYPAWGSHQPTATLGSMQSSPPELLMDPGRGSELPPRRNARARLPSPQQLQAQQPVQAQVSNGVGAQVSNSMLSDRHQPYWRELERGWHPATGVHEARRAASYSPGPGLRRAVQTDPGATLPLHPRHDRLYQYATRPNPGMGLLDGSYHSRGSPDNSYLYHTHNASPGLASNMFSTPPTAPPHRLSPMATTQRRGTEPESAAANFAFAPWELSTGAATGSSPPRRARTPPPRMPSMPRGIGHAEDAPVYPSDAAAMRPAPVDAHFPQQQETQRSSAFQARIAELKGVIGASLQSLDEDEAADTQHWRSSRARTLADREEALWGMQTRPAQDLASGMTIPR